MAQIEKKLGNMADRLQVVKDGLEDAKAGIATVKTELASGKAATMRKFDVLEQQQDSLQQIV